MWDPGAREVVSSRGRARCNRAQIPVVKRFVGEQDQLPSVVAGIQYQPW